MKSKEFDLSQKSRENGRLEVEKKTALATIGRGERVNQDFAKSVCSGYSFLMRAQDLSYRNLLNVLLGDAQKRRYYLG